MANSTTFPHCRYVVHNGGESFHIQLALAGYKQEDLEVTLDRKARELMVRTTQGYRPEPWHHGDANAYLLIDGLAMRAFTWRAQVPQYTQIKSMTFENGLLTIKGVVEVPEEDRPQKIPFNKQEPQLLTE